METLVLLSVVVPYEGDSIVLPRSQLKGSERPFWHTTVCRQMILLPEGVFGHKSARDSKGAT